MLQNSYFIKNTKKTTIPGKDDYDLFEATSASVIQLLKHNIVNSIRLLEF